jgi:hypothetical protein
VPGDRDQSGGEQHDRHQLEPVLDVTDEQQFETHAGNAHHERKEQEAADGGEPLAISYRPGPCAVYESHSCVSP